ncbi:MAG: CHASE2 domain-containing protein, partial [Cohnella sp.]|nr:CHASE2 domain-containing protein [Cohnella sp.]
MKEKIKRVAIVLNVILLIAVYFVYQSHALWKIDHLFGDFNMEAKANGIPDPRIVVVTIDEDSVAALGQFPWDRAVYAQLLANMNQEGNLPKAIAFDVIFSEPSDPDSDMAFAEALAAHPNVVFPVVGNMTNDEVLSNSSIAKRDELIQAGSVLKPYELFADLVQQAHINRVVSPDGIIRQTWLKLKGPDGEIIPSLAYKAVEMAGVDLSKYDDMTDPRKNDDPVAKNTITIDYQLETDDMMSVSFIDVMEGAVPPDLFKDSIVFIGFTAVGLSSDGGQDTGATPIEKNIKLVYAHANIANQLLNGTYVTYAPDWAELLLALILFALFIWLPWKLKNVYSFVIFIVAALGVLYGQYAVYDAAKLHVNIVYALLAMILAYLANVSLKSYLDSVQKSFVTRQFGRYISPDLVKQIVDKDIDIELGGDLKHITILFLDIRGFTPLSEKLTPPELVDTLNTMFNMITETTLRNEGTIDKFIGDAAMILFNAPLNVAEHERMAVKTAYEIQQGMKKIRDEIMERYGCEVNVGIGIHSGNVVVGNIGSYLRVDYTAIGDNVNIAARIESQTRRDKSTSRNKCTRRPKRTSSSTRARIACSKASPIRLKFTKFLASSKNERSEIMRKNLIRLMALLLVVVPFLGVWANESSAASSRVAVIKELTGAAKVKKAGGSKEFTAFAKMSLNEGDVLSVGNGGSALLQFANGTSEDDKMTVGENAKLTFSKLSNKKGTTTKVSMWSGSAWVDVKSIANKDDQFTLETPTAVMGVRGTHFMAVVNPFTGSTQLSVAAGIVSMLPPLGSFGASTPPPQLFYPSQTILALPSLTGLPAIVPAPIDPLTMVNQAGSALIEAMLRASIDIQQENARLMSQYAKDLAVQQSELDRTQNNIDNLVSVLVNQAIATKIIQQATIDRIQEELLRNTGQKTDLSVKEMQLSNEERKKQELQREAEKKSKEEAEKRKLEEAQARNKELIEKIKKQQEEQKKAAEEEIKKKKDKAFSDYESQLDEAGKKRLQEA